MPEITKRSAEQKAMATDSMPKSFKEGNSTFKPSKPADLVRPQGVKPPPPRRTK